MADGNPYSASRSPGSATPCPANWGRRAAVSGFFFVNFFAAYAPGFVWLIVAGGMDYRIIFCPVLLVLLEFDVENPAWATCAVVAFFLVVGVISRLFYRFPVAWVLSPLALFLLCLFQLLVVINFVRGLEAL